MTSTAALPPQQPRATNLDVEVRHGKRHHSPSSDDEVSFSSRDSASDEDLPQQPIRDELPEGEVVGSDTSDPHASSPSEDFSSYSQMLSRLAKTQTPGG